MDNHVPEETKKTIRDLAAAFAAEVPIDAVILVIAEVPEEPDLRAWIVPCFFQKLGLRKKVEIMARTDVTSIDGVNVSMSACDRKAYTKALDWKGIAAGFSEEVCERIRKAMSQRGRSAILSMEPNYLIGIASVPSGAPSRRSARVVAGSGVRSSC